MVWGDRVDRLVGHKSNEVSPPVTKTERSNEIRAKQMFTKNVQSKKSISDKLTQAFTSRTRNRDFPFESVPLSFFGWGDCQYRVRKFTYRRSGHVALARTNRFPRSRRR